MKVTCNIARPAVVAMAVVASASLAHGSTIPVTDWVVHNGTSTVSDAATNSPTFTPDSGAITVMGAFPGVQLLNDGEYIKVTTTMTLDTRTALIGVNALNTQLRIGLFDGPTGAIVANDAPNLGIIIEYSNDGPANPRLIREQTDPAQTNPFVNPTNIGNGDPDANGGSIQGADIGPVDFELTLTRNGGDLDIAGQISGTDSATGLPYLSTYSLPGYTPAAVGFDFNRVGYFFGGNVNSPNGTLNDVIVETTGTVIPEPTSGTLVALVAIAGAGTGRRVRRASRHRR